jgi:hypothetical protein
MVALFVFLSVAIGAWLVITSISERREK